MSDTISTTITQGISLGSAAYPSPLTITSTGAVDPATIASGQTAAVYGVGTLVNDGTILNGSSAVAASLVGVSLFGSITNNGLIGGRVDVSGYSAITNFGTITDGLNPGNGGYAIIGDDTGITITNSGTIIGQVEVYSGTVINSGTIDGNGSIAIFAVTDFRGFKLVVEPGAVFIGDVMPGSEVEPNVVLEVTGTSATALSGIGTSFQHFNEITFASGAAWTVEGALADPTIDAIDGFTLADTLILDGFAAVSDSFVSGTGLVLNNGTTSETLDITGSFANDSFAVTTMDGNSVIQLDAFTHTISKTISTSVTLGSAAYPSPLTITSTGAVKPSGYYNSVYRAAAVSGSGVLRNSGDISGQNGEVKYDGQGGYGVELVGTITNSGTIIGGGDYNGGAGAVLDAGALNNSGTIEGGYGTNFGGIGVKADAGTVSNYGTILSGENGQSGIGLDLLGADATNQANGVIVAGFAGAGVFDGTLTNDGTITGGLGVYLGENATLINAGTIIGLGGPASGGTSPNFPEAVEVATDGGVLIVDPGAVFVGGVEGATLGSYYSGNNGLILAAGTAGTSGSLDLGGQFYGFSTISFAEGASWTLGSGGPGFRYGETTINGFASTDTIVLHGISATYDEYIPEYGLKVFDGDYGVTINITGDFSTSSFLLTPDGDNTDVTLLCYLRGTNIQTPAGEVPVEALNIGDAVITRFNGYRRIKWIGRQNFSRRFIASNLDQIPVRIAAGALGPNLPRRDLLVSPGHSMLIGGILVLAKNMVNGITITQRDCPEEVAYYQLEFETHDCILAEGAWSESFCDYAGLRNQFHNLAEFQALYPNHATPETHQMCAPRPEAGPLLAAALIPVAAHAAALAPPGRLQGWVDAIQPGLVTGWAQDAMNPNLPVLLEIVWGDRIIGNVLTCDNRADLAAAGIGNGRHGFTCDLPNIPRRALNSLRVRRVCDGEELSMAPHCLAALGIKTRMKPQRRAA